MEPEILKFTEFEVAPILDEYAYESGAYDHLLGDDGELIKEQVWSDFLFIEDNIIYVELEKGYITYEVVVQRVSDGKFFKGYYDDGLWKNYYTPVLTEVFPSTISITVYS